MATTKDKLLESAQKNLKKKQVPRAIKDYIKVVELDPADVRSRQKLAELLVRTSRNGEAYEHYEAVAKYFSTNGFYLKAIAIYKQMQRLDSSQVSLFSRLAELNEKQGLIGNAMAEYRSLVSYYERNGMLADAIKVLEKMRDLDAANLNVRVKLAEVYASNERADDGLVEFEGVLSILSEKNDFDKMLKLYKMFMPLYPKNKKLKMGLALTLYEKGELQKGVTILVGLLQEYPNDPDLLRLVGRGYNDAKDWQKASDVYQQLLTFDPTDLDVRELFIKCSLDSQQYDQALAELEEWKDAFLKADRLELLQEFYELLKENLPDNAAVLQTLDSIYEITGDGDKLLDILAEQHEPPVESTSVETLSDSLLGSVEEDIELPSIDLDFTLDDAEDTDDLFVAAAEEEEILIDVPIEESDLQFDVMEEADSLSLDDELVAEDSIIELDLDLDSELDPEPETALNLDVVGESDFSFDLQAEEDPLTPSIEERDIVIDLEEADFYIQQGLYSEAEKFCLDILAYAPDSEECRRKLTDIQSHLHPESSLVEKSQSSSAEILDKSFPSSAEDVDIFSAVEETVAEKKVFKTDVDEQIAADDMESHYNLGIAYREMGLLVDAISEFSKAEKDPSRYVDCQTLKGLCYSEKGDIANAEVMFQQALDSQHLEDDQRLSLCYELASLYESATRDAEALSSYRLVMSLDQSYRDVSTKVKALQEKVGALPETPIEIKKDRISFL